MKIAIITDTHAGARSSSSIFREYMKYWYENEFFPKLKENGVTTILHLGDFFDNRNAISLSDIDFIVNWFAQKIIEGDYKFFITLGNHDVAFKNTNKIHSLSILAAAAPKNVIVIEEPMMLDNFALVPWINSSNYDSTMLFLSDIEDKANTIVAGHFEFAGFKHYKTSPPADHGMDTLAFKDFDQVWSGHYHHKSKIANVMYMGSAFHLNWQDYGDERGFHLYDTKSKNLEYVENKTCLFLRVSFEPEVFDGLDVSGYNDLFEGMFVQLVVDGEYDKVALMDTVSKINRCKPHNLQIINNSVATLTDEGSTDEVVDNTTKTTKEYIVDYISARNEYSDAKISDIIKRIHDEAHEILVKGE